MLPTWRVLNVTLGRDRGLRTIDTAQGRFEIRDYPLETEKTLSIVLRAIFINRVLKNYDLIVTSDYFASFALNLRLALSFCGTPHVTIGLNQSRRALRTGISPFDRLIAWIFSRGTLFFVHSRHEASLFRGLHGISAQKLCFVLWGFDLPQLGGDRFDNGPGQYVCMIGRNNRDIETFFTAVDGLAVEAVLITSRHQQIRSSLPPNVRVYTDLSMEDCLSCIKHSRANLILVNDDQRGAGHITAVAAMLLGTPQIVSDARVLNDYFVDGYNCIKVPIGNAASVQSAIEMILTSSTLSSELSLNGRLYASRWLTRAAVEKGTFGVVAALLSGCAISSVDPTWEREYEQLHVGVARRDFETIEFGSRYSQ